MKLTRRGWAVVVLVVAAVGSGALFGARGLNAVAAPGVVALLAAAVQARRFDPPTVERELPARGGRGETVAVRLHLETGTPFGARVRDLVPDGVDATGNDRQVTVGETTLRYELHLRERGEQPIGPASIVARDVLGLVAEEYRHASADAVLVRPRVYLLAGPRRDDLVWLYGGAGDDRLQFDHLRRYERGDPLRDVHWRSSAKQPGDDFVVKEFTTDEGTRTVELAAAAESGHDDAMADAAASIAADLLDAGVRVGLATPDGRVPPDAGAEQLERVLDHLARAGPGDLRSAARSRADVVVESSDAGTRVDLAGRDCAFAELAGRSLDEPVGTTVARPAEVAAT